jgi:hypothetical protein
MKKPKFEPPKRFDFVKLRGRDAKGLLYKMDDETKWCTVEWDPDHKGPKYVHLFELEKINNV